MYSKTYFVSALVGSCFAILFQSIFLRWGQTNCRFQSIVQKNPRFQSIVSIHCGFF